MNRASLQGATRWAATLVLVGCTTSPAPPAASDASDASSVDADVIVDADVGIPDADVEVPEPEPEEPSPSARFVRLTHLQWELSVRDLFRLEEPTGLSSTFIGDPAGSGFSTNTEQLDVSPDLWADYQRVSEDVARLIVLDAARLEAIFPPDMPSVEVELSDEENPCFGQLAEGELPSCCDGAGSCVSIEGVPEVLQAEVAPCDDGGACVPNEIVDRIQDADGYWLDAWAAWSVPCESIGGYDGTCMSTCIPKVGDFADMLPQGICAADQRCVPCVDLLTMQDSGACTEGWGCAAHGPAVPPEVLAAARDAYLGHFLPRAFRRPVSVEELARYAELYDQGPELLERDEPLEAGVEITLRAVLQSPHFLYRVERSTEAGPDGLVALDGWEIATRLSYVLWNTTPPDELLAAAETGQLDTAEGVLAQAKAMIDDPRAIDMVVDFHNQLLHTNAYTDIQKQPGMFPEFGEETGRHMATEVALFVEDIVFGDGEGGLTELLTATHTFVNDDLSVFYGLDPADYGEAFERVSLDAEERSGLLTRLGFLADRSTLTQPDPIRRGVLVAERIICAHLPPPPPTITALPLTTAPTNRERVDLHTGDGTCGEGCHSTIINPAGFPFEHYDAIGRYRLEDNGYPVNAADTYVLDGAEVAYQDAVAFSEVLSESLQVHQCYVDHWFEYLFGRPPGGQDQPLVDQVASASLSGELSIEEILGALLASDAFLKRVPDEEAAR